MQGQAAKLPEDFPEIKLRDAEVRLAENLLIRVMAGGTGFCDTGGANPPVSMSQFPVPPAEMAKVRHAGFFPDFRKLPALLLGLVSLCLPIQAQTIYWGSEGFVSNVDSRGRGWNADFSLSLGVFHAGFKPEWANREQWTSQWIELAVADFDPAEQRFAGIIDGSVPLPEGAGRQVHFWAKNGVDLTQGPEWLLVTHADWRWPAGGALSPALTWTTQSAALVVIGRPVNQAGHHFTSAAMRPVPIPRDEWLAAHFKGRLQDAHPHLDPDGDGLSNALEYLLGSDPTCGASTGRPRISSAAGHSLLQLSRNPYAESYATLETTTDLGKWTVANPAVREDRPDLLEVLVPRDPAKPAAFFRFKLEPAAP